MAEKYNATCSICGEPYHKCLSCKDSMAVRPWQVHTDTSEHYKVFQIIRGFSTGVYKKDEAREKFKNVNLEDLETFRPHIKDIIKDILKEDKKVVAPIIEPIAKVEVESVEEVKTASSRKRNLKTEVETDKVKTDVK